MVVVFAGFLNTRFKVRQIGALISNLVKRPRRLVNRRRSFLVLIYFSVNSLHTVAKPGTAPTDRAEESWFLKEGFDGGLLACRAYERLARDLRSKRGAGVARRRIHALGGAVKE